MCPVNSQNKEKLAQYAVSPAHGRGGSQDEVKLAYEQQQQYYYYCTPLRPLPRPRAPWLAARGENFTTPSVYSSSLLHTLVSTPSIYLYKATIKNTFCIYTRPQIVIEKKVTTPSFPVYGSISKSLQPRQTVSGRINFVVCTSNQYARFSQEVMFTEALIRTNACML